MLRCFEEMGVPQRNYFVSKDLFNSMLNFLNKITKSTKAVPKLHEKFKGRLSHFGVLLASLSSEYAGKFVDNKHYRDLLLGAVDVEIGGNSISTVLSNFAADNIGFARYLFDGLIKKIDRAGTESYSRLLDAFGGLLFARDLCQGLIEQALDDLWVVTLRYSTYTETLDLTLKYMQHFRQSSEAVQRWIAKNISRLEPYLDSTKNQPGDIRSHPA
jgi:hypothetical protein